MCERNKRNKKSNIAIVISIVLFMIFLLNIIAPRKLAVVKSYAIHSGRDNRTIHLVEYYLNNTSNFKDIKDIVISASNENNKQDIIIWTINRIKI